MWWRADLIFSYWIFAWFLLYIAGMVSISPKFALMMAFLEFAVTFFLVPEQIKTAYLLANIVIKIVPFMLVVDDMSFSQIEVVLTALLFCIYACYLYVNGTTVSRVYGLAQKSASNMRRIAPLTRVIQRGLVRLRG